jgi:hypothetical protein
MKYKTLFRLLVKGIGLFFVVFGVAFLPNSILSTILTWTPGQSNPWVWGTLFAGAVPVALGLYLSFGGRWIVNLAIPSNRPYCPECAYDLTGVPVERCPECGTTFRWEDVKPKTEVRSEK